MECLNCKIKTTNPKFCSLKCAAIYNNNKRIKISHPCKSCGIIIVGWKSKYNIYCTKKCEVNFRWHGEDAKQKMIAGEFKSGASKAYMHRNYHNCFVCGIGEIWNKKKLVLQVDHIDGNSDNNKLENLRLICPNCHTQTDTFCQRNHKNTKRNSYLRRYKNKVLNMK